MKRLAVTSLLLALTVGASSTLNAATGTATASTGGVLERATKAKRLTDPPPLAVVGVQEDGLSGVCTLRAKNAGEPRKGVKGTFDAILIDANTGTQISDLGKKKGKTNKEGVLTADYPIPRMADFAIQAAMVVELDLRGGKKITEYEFACELHDETL